MVCGSPLALPRSFGASVRNNSSTKPRDTRLPFSLGPPSAKTLSTPRCCIKYLSACAGSGYPPVVSGMPSTSAAPPRLFARAGAFLLVVITRTSWPACETRFSRSGTSPPAARMTARGCRRTRDALSRPSESLSALRVPAPTITAPTCALTLRIVALSTSLPTPETLPPTDACPSTEATMFVIVYGRS